ncbi:MAG TPA: transcriptional regulator, partial [Stenomitos sp.]
GYDITSANGNEPIPTLEKKVVKEIWQQSCEAMRMILQQSTLQDLCDRRDEQKQSELMYYI